jgi:hypothetical protein
VSVRFARFRGDDTAGGSSERFNLTGSRVRNPACSCWLLPKNIVSATHLRRIATRNGAGKTGFSLNFRKYAPAVGTNAAGQ